MVQTRPTGERGSGAIRADGGGGFAPAERARGSSGGGISSGFPRIPSRAQLASLLVDGILMLPRNYRRGMYLDINA